MGMFEEDALTATLQDKPTKQLEDNATLDSYMQILRENEAFRTKYGQ